MNRLYRAFLASRVARRVFALFVASALVPLALTALLSVTYVRDTLLEQGQQRLAANAKAYGTAVFGRLLDAADRLQHQAPGAPHRRGWGTGRNSSVRSPSSRPAPIDPPARTRHRHRPHRRGPRQP